jgi:hypothetical protein
MPFPGTGGSPSFVIVQRVTLESADWAATAYLARTFADRLLGVWRVPEGATVILPASSVHSLCRRRPLQVAGLDGSMRVTTVRTLRPNRFAVLPGARLVIEAPEGERLPAPGQLVEMSDG